MKVLMIAAHCPPYHNGGYGAVARAFAEGLAGRGHDVRIVTQEPRGDRIGDEPSVPVDRTLEAVRPGDSPRKLFRTAIVNTVVVRDRIQTWKPDVVFSCGSDGIGFNTYHTAISSAVPSLTYLGDTWLAQAWRSLPNYDAYVDMARGGRRSGINRRIKRAIGWLGRRASLIDAELPPRFAPVTAISPFVVDDLRAAGAPVPATVPMSYIPLSHDYFNEDGEPIGPDRSSSAAFRALFVSRMEPLKGPDAAIAGVAAAVHAGHNVTLTMAGIRMAAMQPELTAQAESLGIAGRVCFAGTPGACELRDLYRSHDVFLFPSRIVEGLGIVNCEAQACGLPIIGVADSGAAEAIRHAETGFRIAIDDTAAMGRYLGELASNRGLWQSLSANALHNAKRFHPDRIIDTIEQALKDAIQP
jgi:glycosyltransferase involved in cell wall biosynthesis